MLHFTLKSQKLIMRNGFRDWETVYEDVEYAPGEIAVIIVDMWDRHWSCGATMRGAKLADRINAAVMRAREKGMLIVHAPSETMQFYEGTEARERLLSVPQMEHIPYPVDIADYPLPIDSSDGGSDTEESDPPNTRVWTRQTEKILIDQSRDIICGDEGDRLFSYLTAKGIKFLIYLGVHTNMCILERSFAIKSMLRRGMKAVLVRDLTDAMYNPEKPPYVSHEEGTRLVVEFIEKKYCPTIDSSQL